MMVIDRRARTWSDSLFVNLPSYLRDGDALVLNNTRVFPARLIGERTPSGGRVELLLLEEIWPNIWETRARPARRLGAGARLKFDSELFAEVLECREDGVRVLRFECNALADTIERIGQTPLPPYIKRDAGTLEEDRERYQTVYAKNRGAIAAPTAGLHFTDRVLNRITATGANLVEITLHVGYGTFEPVRVDDVNKHRVAPEHYSISDEAAADINRARLIGRHVIAVGTTTTRALEFATNENRVTESRSGTADLTILPGHQFRAVDALLTNFHLPRSSLLMLVSAFAGRELVLAAYRHAVKQKYRFYSYGDCMLII